MPRADSQRRGPEVLVLYLKRPFTAHRNDRSSLVGASDTALRLIDTNHDAPKMDSFRFCIPLMPARLTVGSHLVPTSRQMAGQDFQRLPFSDFELIQRPYCGLRFSGLPIARRKMATLPFACGEKKLITSSSKKVSPVAPRHWAYAARYILPSIAPASSWTAR